MILAALPPRPVRQQKAPSVSKTESTLQVD